MNEVLWVMAPLILMSVWIQMSFPKETQNKGNKKKRRMPLSLTWSVSKWWLLMCDYSSALSISPVQLQPQVAESSLSYSHLSHSVSSHLDSSPESSEAGADVPLSRHGELSILRSVGVKYGGFSLDFCACVSPYIRAGPSILGALVMSYFNIYLSDISQEIFISKHTTYNNTSKIKI